MVPTPLARAFTCGHHALPSALLAGVGASLQPLPFPTCRARAAAQQGGRGLGSGTGHLALQAKELLNQHLNEGVGFPPSAIS